MARRNLLIVLAGLLAAAAPPALAGQTQVAVAANFTAPAKDIAAAFKPFLAFLKGPEARAAIAKYGYSAE